MSVSRRATRQADHEDCQSVATLVMALFDGEADELQARRARKHLLICQTCANRWLDWNSARSLLLSVPAPTPPETMVWRVLSACRRAGAQRARSTAISNPVFDAPLEVPSALSQQILQRTTRASASDTANTRRASWSNSRRVLAWPALVAPSLALWLLVLQREPLLTSAQVGPDASESSAAALDSRFPISPNRANRVSRRAMLRPAANFRLAAPRSTGINAAGANAALDSSPNVRQDTPAETETTRADVQQPILLTNSTADGSRTKVLSNSEIRLARQWNEIQALTSQAARSVVFQPSETGSETASETDDAAWQTADYRVEFADSRAAPRTVLARLTATPRRIALAARLRRTTPKNSRGAELSNALASPRLRTTNWRISMPRGAFSGSTASPAVPSRVSLPANMAPATSRLLAENFDAEDPRADDGHLDEMRSVVDDFRATVASETTPDAGEDDGG